MKAIEDAKKRKELEARRANYVKIIFEPTVLGMIFADFKVLEVREGTQAAEKGVGRQWPSRLNYGNFQRRVSAAPGHTTCSHRCSPRSVGNISRIQISAGRRSAEKIGEG